MGPENCKILLFTFYNARSFNYGLFYCLLMSEISLPKSHKQDVKLLFGAPMQKYNLL